MLLLLRKLGYDYRLWLSSFLCKLAVIILLHRPAIVGTVNIWTNIRVKITKTCVQRFALRVIHRRW